MTKQYRYFSAYSHFECPPDMWTHRVPKAHRERAPRRVKLPNGNDIIVEEGKPITFRGTNQFAGKSIETFSPVGLDFDNAVGAGTPQQRLKEQDADGIDAELLFASEARNSTIQDKAAFLAIVQGFNDYFIEEYCSVAPDRLVGVAVLPDIGVDEDIAEMKRCKEKGFKAVRLHTFPSGKRFPTPEDDRFWAAALDFDMPLTIHTSFRGNTAVVIIFYCSIPRSQRVKSDRLIFSSGSLVTAYFTAVPPRPSN